ncbi:MAG TPA: hypothetical protein VD793_03605, partial [Gemmatimonadales bacterium]|nr:hypothetical protein [Gemmatimonadales bacterium]
MSLTRWLMVGLCITACDRAPRPAAFVGATLITGARADPVADAVVVVRNGRIEAVGPRDAVAIPGDAAVTDLAGRTIIPGLINTHGHVGDTRGLESGHYSVENVVEQLGRYARYGVTT